MRERNGKGNRIYELADLPKEYVIVDTETTGIGDNSRILQISALHIVDGNITDRFNSYVRSVSHVPRNITELTGITDEIIESAPMPEEVLKVFGEFVGKNCVVAHNATFDINKLYDAYQDYLNYTFNNDYYDTLYLARHTLSNLENYKLQTICSFLNVDCGESHHADSDCEALYNCMLKMINIPEIYDDNQTTNINVNHGNSHHAHGDANMRSICNEAMRSLKQKVIYDYHLDNNYNIFSLSNWLDYYKEISECEYYDDIYERVSTIIIDGRISEEEYDDLISLINNLYHPDSEIYNCFAEDINTYNGKNVCVTGEFENIARARVESILISHGAAIKNTPTSKTDYVIVGSKGSAAWSCGNYGSKIKKALDLIQSGKNIGIISEETFLKTI